MLREHYEQQWRISQTLAASRDLLLSSSASALVYIIAGGSSGRPGLSDGLISQPFPSISNSHCLLSRSFACEHRRTQHYGSQDRDRFCMSSNKIPICSSHSLM